ncbi:Adenine-specific methyltransferase EcoRI [Fibrobacter sp. UWT2]|jgi:hypothetical protein|uniref:adenine-specific methyltransferase EcoRI family protein n=1 Tax=Fibrobacter sp. UWT2 TaxID=1896224 RepID=UPI00091C8B20|nr:adenine-specific methyltransferase EcoRI family protein [Fibrobacter sp. UWT2]SHL31347.1 Adenine-specific methyltransferase EcoRI [Fibrobacter sp. UWT2]
MPTRIERIQKSKRNAEDEFYTIYADIAAELPNYRAQLKGKRVLCPCDWDESFEQQIVYSDGSEVRSPDLFNNLNFVKDINIDETRKSFEKKIDLIKCNFIKFLVSHADAYKIKSISVSGFNPAMQKGIRFQDIDYSNYDVVITNPPFSQFREFIDTMFKNKMQFLVIGPQNAITYKECFKYIYENKMWIGYHFHMTGFDRPDGTHIPKNDNKVRSCCWFTNMEVSLRHDEMILTEEYSPERYPKYVNYDAIHVKETNLIPYDYPDEMSVPITFLQKYNPEQFEILGCSGTLAKPMREIAEKGEYQQGGAAFYRLCPDGKYKYHREFPRIVVKNKKVRHDED